MKNFWRWGISVSLLGSLAPFACGQQRALQICARDPSGRAIAEAHVRVANATPAEAISDASGCVHLTIDPTAPTTVQLTRQGFGTITQPLGTAPELTIVMQPATLREVVEVTAARTPLALDATASSVRSLTQTQLAEAPGLALDDKLRQVAGYQLFRRTSSWVANPTTQGTSLRGLGSTAASRTLVLSDQVPLNDAFGGWIHWNEAPQLAVAGVELMRGGASDLYGSSAIGGVIDVTPVRPEGNSYAFDLSGANRNTSLLNGLVTAGAGPTKVLVASTLFRTDGYILTAPEVRGAVDVPSNVHSQSGRIELRRELGTDDGVFLRGNIYNEARSNGTPVTTNATRLWRYVGGGDWVLPKASRLMFRVYGTQQGYRQSFSSIAANRATERLTRLQRVPTQQLGGAVQWAQTYKTLTFVAGGDLMDTRATDDETPVTNNVNQATISISARQRQGGVYGEVLWQPQNWSIALSSRVDRFHSFDARQVTSGVGTTLPATDEFVFDPRLGVVRKLRGGISLTASGFRAFRGPSMNELYRTGQVGQQTTQANANLRSERATGFEVGTLLTRARLGSLRASYFWTQVNRPVAAVTLSSTPTSVLLQRQNLGQLTSKGFTVEADARPASWLNLSAGYQYADSTVTKFQADPTLVGKWTAQVPRNTASAQARMERQRLGVFAVDLRTSGQQFDDSANVFRLAGYAQVDLYGEHSFAIGAKNRLRVYGSVQNVSGDPVQAGRTPILTLGIPRTVSVGIKIGAEGMRRSQ
ncbi:TonB-dependent receptor [Granulicella sp. dw_53]|uniref:TonB-dependent receptor n=1 Tax=Granulicella sp. dw_53 TaxID=2719792 RepID=UPI001BD55736|nr:TonB-dependent receptor [Granulicella sp. dw_53]